MSNKTYLLDPSSATTLTNRSSTTRTRILPAVIGLFSLVVTSISPGGGTAAYAGTQHQGTQHQGTQHQGTQHQGTQHQGTQHQGTQHQGTQHQGTQHQGAQHQGTVLSESDGPFVGVLADTRGAVKVIHVLADEGPGVSALVWTADTGWTHAHLQARDLIGVTWNAR